jgi:protein AaeX
MIGEAEFDGVFVPYLLLLTVVAFLALLPIRWLLRRAHLYRFVWHAGLFDIALFMVILWLTALATARLGSGGLGS